MRPIRSADIVRACAALSIAASALVHVGCGDDKAKEAGNAATPPTITKANNEMQNFAKTAPKK